MYTRNVRSRGIVVSESPPLARGVRSGTRPRARPPGVTPAARGVLWLVRQVAETLGATPACAGRRLADVGYIEN